tara:strand:- start:343 stop:906 length:564 start_codon:yes stop_codon:yes gene_type:complete
MSYIFVKNILDIIFSFCLLIFTAPILIVCIILIKLESKGPMFFTQERVGKDGVIFKIFKLRTMKNNCQQKKGQVFLNNSQITRVGFYLRRFKIDELPQILNVLLGQMSIIGPRPCLPSLLENFDKNAKFRLKVKPGLTGWSQVNGNIYNSWPKRWELDKYYVENVSFLLDLRIFVLTTGVIILGEKK